MDYVVGGVAALISGNVTPNRPKLLKRAFTPTKHQPSPNVTPKSELVADRSIFLSPTMQKKKAIVKKSPKRIFQSTDMDVIMDGDDSNCVPIPQADKVKKHLKNDIESSTELSKSSQKEGKSKRDKSVTHTERESNEGDDYSAPTAESKPKKNKKQRNSISETKVTENDGSEKLPEPAENSKSARKKNRKRNKSESKDEIKEDSTAETSENPVKMSKAKMRRERMKKMKLRHLKKTEKEAKSKLEADLKNIQEFIQDDNDTPAPKAKKSKKSVVPEMATEQENHISEEPQLDKETEGSDDDSDGSGDDSDDLDDVTPKTVNPNAITDKDTDSEHESDDDIESEDDEENKKVLAPDADENNSSDEDEEEEKKTVKGKVQKSKKSEEAKTDNSKPERSEFTGPTAEELKRTIFVGNVPFSSKCKKEIKKIFSKYGEIETVRIRTVPVADARVTPKLAIIKNELHPERTAVNVYVKFVDEAAVETALNENNTKLNHHHLRVTRSETTGAEHDPRLAVYVGNIPFGLEDEGLRARFEKCGEIESVRIVRDKKTNAGKGFGYVNFVSKDGVELALALPEEDLTIKNRILRVSRCQQNPTKKKPQTGQNRGPPAQRGSFGQSRGQSGQDRGSFGQNRGSFGQNRGSFGQNRGTFGQNRGSFGQNRGSFGQNRGSFGQNRGPPGQNRGASANRGGFSQNRGQGRGSVGPNRGAQGNWQNRGPPANRGAGEHDEQAHGAHRRVMNKRKSADGGSDEPASKKPNVGVDQPNKEKKQKKEFVGMTAEKKKKNKVSKGDKKKKALSEILTKK